MTQDNNLVSPSTSACPKPGASKTCARSAQVLNRTGSSLRLSETGDTSAHVARISQSARVTPRTQMAPSSLAPASWSASGPTPLFPLLAFVIPLSFVPLSFVIPPILSPSPIAHRPSPIFPVSKYSETRRFLQLFPLNSQPSTLNSVAAPPRPFSFRDLRKNFASPNNF